jgi:hypothetical protein
MPSPFPGMDPYLEAPELWRGFHARFLTVASGFLNRDLRAEYYVEVDERLYVVGPEDESYQLFLPDLALVRDAGQTTVEVAANGTSGDDWQGLAVTAPTLTLRAPLIEIRETFLRIERTDSREVVTVVEMLSPTNKHPGNGRSAYDDKRRKLLRTGVNLVEIDLLRDGLTFLPAAADMAHDYSVAVWEPTGDDHPLSRQTRIWLFDVTASLPRIPIPLHRGDGQIVLDLQAVFEETWSLARYEKRMDYSMSPPPPSLRADARAWLKSRGLGPATTLD